MMSTTPLRPGAASSIGPGTPSPTAAHTMPSKRKSLDEVVNHVLQTDSVNAPRRLRRKTSQEEAAGEVPAAAPAVAAVAASPGKLRKAASGNVASPPAQSQAKAGRGGSGKMKTKAVDKIRDVIVSEFEEHCAALGQAATDKELDKLDSAMQSSVTLWGKKRGALLSSDRLDDAAEVADYINEAGALRKVLSSYRHWAECRTDKAANAFIGATIDKQLTKSTTQFPSSIVVEVAMAKAHLSVVGGNFDAVVEAISMKKLQPQLGDTGVSHLAKETLSVTSPISMRMMASDAVDSCLSTARMQECQ